MPQEASKAVDLRCEAIRTFIVGHSRDQRRMKRAESRLFNLHLLDDNGIFLGFNY